MKPCGKPRGGRDPTIIPATTTTTTTTVLRFIVYLRMQPGQQAYHRYKYAEPAGRLYIRATGNRLLCRDGGGGECWPLSAACD